MTGLNARPAALVRRSALLLLSGILLSSCSATSDPVERLGLGLAPASAASTLALGSGASADELTATASLEQGSADQPYSFVSDDDPVLPETASAVPSLQNRPEAADATVQLASAAAAPGALSAAAVPDTRRFAPGQTAPVAAPTAAAAAQAIAAVRQQGDVTTTGSAFAAAPRKGNGFLSGMFSNNPQPAPQPQIRAQNPIMASLAPAQAKPLLNETARPVVATGRLPGVRDSALFEIKRHNGSNSDDDIDLHEDEEEDIPVQLASAAGLARLAPNGLITQTERVDVACLRPSLVRVLKQIEGHYNKKAMVTSGYRSPPVNKRARGAKNSLHMYCAAADIKVEGVTKFELAQYLRSMPGRGGVGTYCHTDAVHVDVGPERDWNWRCRRKKRR